MNILKVLLQKTMLVNFLLGISGGIPLALTGKTLQAWFTDANLGLSIVGLFSLVGLPYSLKFLWAPVFDRFTPPFLGRRRGWLIITQVACAAAIVFLAFTPPNGDLPLSARLPEGVVSFLAWLNPKLPDSHLSFVIILACFLVSITSASQDIVIDAYRRESLKDEELGMGASVYVYGYRIAMYLSGGAVFFIADLISWPTVYIACAVLLGVGVAATLWADEPEVHGKPRNFREAVVEPLREFFGREGALVAVTVLAFILLYKVGDTMAGNVTINFYKEHMGFSNAQIGAIAKSWGLIAALTGAFIGGVVILKVGIKRALVIGGVLQAASTAGFALIARMFANYNPVDPAVKFADTSEATMALAGVIAFEDITGAIGTAAFVAFMAAQTNKRFTATQYAVLTSLIAVPRTFLAAPGGIMAANMGFQAFFYFCTFAAIPGLLLLVYMVNSPKFNNFR